VNGVLAVAIRRRSAVARDPNDRSGSRQHMQSLQHWQSLYRHPIKQDGNNVKRPCLASLLVGLIPFIAVCFSVPLWHHIHPMFLGLPFNLFWLISWILPTPLCVFVGMIVDVATAAYLVLNKMDPFLGLNAGFFALCVNFVATTLVSLFTPLRASPFEKNSEGSAVQ
jgi:hypothetical protein